jgi:predicted O-methyltransferase YrrM
MDIVDRQIQAYLDKILAVNDPILREMQRYGESRHFPIVGPQVGRLLYFLAQTIGATRVLELGSGFGYSAMWFASAVGPQGRVVMTESSKENVDRARDYIKRAGMSKRIQIEQGDALEILKRLPGWFDLIYNDVDKHDYPRTLDLVRSKLRPGGLFITDNILWSGTVLGPARSADVRGIKEFTKLLMEAPDFITTMLPVRDGVAVALKTK